MKGVGGKRWYRECVVKGYEELTLDLELGLEQWAAGLENRSLDELFGCAAGRSSSTTRARSSETHDRVRSSLGGRHGRQVDEAPLATLSQ